MAAFNLSPEVHFAQKLAANEKRIRDKAFKKLKKWLQLKSSKGKEADFLKIWKGLHYCMWMQDKPLIQEELSDNLAKLIHVFGNIDISLLFLGVFFQTEAREWNGLDRWRLDKFMMLSRGMLGQAFLMLKKTKWKEAHVDSFIHILRKHVLLTEDDSITDGYRIHIIDIYLEELEKIGAEVLSPSQVTNFLEPFSTFIAESENTELVKRVVKRIFDSIIEQAVDDAKKRAERLLEREDDDDEENKENEDISDDEIPPRLDYDYGAIADRLFSLGKDASCLSRHRTIIYNLVKKFRDLNEGVLPIKNEDYSDLGKTSITKQEFAKSVDSIISMESSTHKKKRKKKNKKRKAAERDVNEPTGNNESEENEKKAKKIKRDHTESISGKETKTKNAKSVNQDKNQLKTKEAAKEKKEGGLTKLKDKMKILGKRKKESELDDVVKGEKTKSNVSKSKRLKVSASVTSSEDVQDADSYKVHVGLDTLALKHLHDKDSSTTERDRQGDDGMSKEVEIWIPNKKYKGKLKEQFEKEMTKAFNSETGDSYQDKIFKKFATFEDTKSTPTAFVRKSAVKLSTPKTDPGRLNKTLSVNSDTGSKSCKKKVKFDMKKNRSVDFKKSIQFSPVPFNSKRKPEQSILKTPDESSRQRPVSQLAVTVSEENVSDTKTKAPRPQTPHISKIKLKSVKRTPSSLKKMTGTGPYKTIVKTTPVLSVKKSTPRGKAANFFL